MSASQKPFTLDPTQIIHFVLFSLMACPPNFLWQMWLEQKFPGYLKADPTATKSEKANGTEASMNGNGSGEPKKRVEPMTTSNTPQLPQKTARKLNLKNTLKKFALDQTLGAAINTVLFIAGIALLRGQSLTHVQSSVQQKFWPMIFAGQKLWPAVSLLSFTVIPVERRTLFGGIVGVFWGVYLGLVAGKR